MIPLLGLVAPTVRDLYADTWVATDALGRQLPIAPRTPRKDRFVGMFYFVWHGLHGTPGPYDLSKILAGKPPEYGPVGAFHWWGEPEAGYFRSDDPWIARRNLEMLAEAGVDCLFVDVTNAFTYRDEMTVLFDAAERMRAQGDPTPQIAFILNAAVPATVQRLWDDWYRPRRHEDLWFRWPATTDPDPEVGGPLRGAGTSASQGYRAWSAKPEPQMGKPLILADPTGIPDEQRAFFTWRRSWFESDPKGWFGDGRDRWPWRDRTPQNYGWHDDPKVPEEVAVGVASHPTLNLGRSYANGKEPDRPGAARGVQFQEQWDRALAVDPKLVFVTGWNEWVAQRFTVAPGQSIDLLGRRLATGDTFFVDQYSPEFSRDLDPMKGGFADDYYYQLVANVRRYKGARPVPKASEPKTISISGPFAQWSEVGPEYRDAVGDTLHRDHAGWGSLWYKDDGGRNDIVVAKVARDRKTIAFYVRTAAPLTPRSDPDWMVLYLDTDRNAATGWHGYEFRVARGGLERWDGAWQRVADVPTKVAGAEMMLTLPRRFVGASFDFKWADHCGDSGEFIVGDAAPPRRFKFRYAP